MERSVIRGCFRRGGTDPGFTLRSIRATFFVINSRTIRQTVHPAAAAGAAVEEPVAAAAGIAAAAADPAGGEPPASVAAAALRSAVALPSEERAAPARRSGWVIS